jgi:hypothetical protein
VELTVIWHLLGAYELIDILMCKGKIAEKCKNKKILVAAEPNLIARGLCIPVRDFTPSYFFTAWSLIKYGNDITVTF